MCDREYLYELIIRVVEQGEFLRTFDDNLDLSAELKKELEKLSYSQLLEKLIEVVKKYVYCDENGVYDSRALSSYADALYFLARKMYFKISFACGREVVGEFTDGIEKRLEFLKKVEVFQERIKKGEKVEILERLGLGRGER